MCELQITNYVYVQITFVQNKRNTTFVVFFSLIKKKKSALRYSTVTVLLPPIIKGEGHNVHPSAHPVAQRKQPLFY